MIYGIALSVLAYLSGSIPSGAILTRWRAKFDITSVGSGNIGATNVLRQAGPALGIATLAADMAKGAFPVFLAFLLCQSPPGREIWMAVVAVCAFCGHLFPVYSRLKKGGKGVATAAGCVLVFSPQALAAAFLVFAVCVAVSRRASVGSLAASAALCPAVFLFTGQAAFSGAVFIMAVLIWVRHKDNIKRLLARKEPRIF